MTKSKRKFSNVCYEKKEIVSYKFQDSIQTFALFKESAFLSAFAGFLILGVPSANGFRKKSCFKFNFCDFFLLFREITEIVQFLGKSDILKKSGQIVNSYCWNGETVSKEIDSKMYQEKIVTFLTEQNNEHGFKMTFTIPQIDNLFELLGRLMFYTLCLKDHEMELLFEASLNPIEAIIALKNDNLIAKQFVSNFLAKISQNVKKQPLVEILKYYNELILIVHKLLLLSNSKVL